MKPKKKIAKILTALILLVAVERFCRVQTAGFRIDKIYSDSVCQITHPPFDAPHLLRQRFSFLGSGVQCYAFLGEDGETVLKVFKHYHNFPIKGVFKTLPLPEIGEKWRTAILKKRERRMQAIFSSCALAALELKEETALIATHLVLTDHLEQTITLVDKIGIAHEIAADRTAFILQRRAQTLAAKVEQLRKMGDRKRLEECLCSVIQLIVQRVQKGIENTDPHIERNIGFFNDRAIEMDIGSYVSNIQCSPRKEMKTLKRWIKKHAPELAHYVDAQIEKTST